MLPFTGENCMTKRNNLKVVPVFASQVKKLRKRFCWVDQPLHGSVLTPISCTRLKIHSAHADSHGSLTHFYVLPFTGENCIKKKQFRGRASLCFTDQEAQEEILLGGPTPSWVSAYTHLLYKAQDPFSACRRSWFLNTFLCTAIYY